MTDPTEPDELTRKEWCASRDINWRYAQRVSAQIRTHYCSVHKLLRGEPIDLEDVERDLIQLVRDTQVGRFPVSHAAKRLSS